jgi:hypothetical protein
MGSEDEGNARPPPSRRTLRGQGQAVPRRDWGRWLSEPRAAVLIVLFLIVVVGGGRKLLRGWRGRGVIGRLGAPDVAIQDIEAAIEFGREGLVDLFRIQGTADSAALRDAAGRALAVLWARDELIAEEEQALVRRGLSVTWHARLRYPRALQGPIPIAVSYGIPFLHDHGDGVAPASLEWSHTILGARRAALESPSPWKAGPGTAEFTIVPGDFETDGPHRLILKPRVRTTGLSGPWELDLPQIPMSFEFDPRLSIDALFSLPDADRAEAMNRAIQLLEQPRDEQSEAVFLHLSPELTLRQPPVLAITVPLACDLAHSMAMEFEGFGDPIPAGEVILGGQGARTDDRMPTTRTFTLGPMDAAAAIGVDRPGSHRMRVRLTPRADLGWAEPDIRSIWPETIVTGWVEVQIVRR